MNNETETMYCDICEVDLVESDAHISQDPWGLHAPTVLCDDCAANEYDTFNEVYYS